MQDVASSKSSGNKSGWQRHFVYRKESLRTTWKLRFSLLILILLTGWIPRGFWAEKIGQSLACQEQIRRSEGLLLENFDPDYLVFERAAALERANLAEQVFVPVDADDSHVPDSAYQGFTEVMTRTAGLTNIQIIPIRETEPISLNSANQIRDFLMKQGVHSILVVTPGFRSRRSFFVYNTVLSRANISVGCVPVFGTVDVSNWTRTWHGMQEVGLQFFKLQYYRFYVLR
jgi:hypothetical protein